MENTATAKGKDEIVKDHLHLRGEYKLCKLLKSVRSGSSPLTWRIQLCVYFVPVFTRIISTYVENTSYVNLSNLSIKDHLHLRGEYLDTLRVPRSILGSSPLTWRIQELGFALILNDRIISTYVENTSTPFSIVAASKDHLHLRGEYS